MQSKRFDAGNLVVTKKKHPCSSDVFKILRVGSDIRLICTGCKRDMTLPREKFEKMIKKILPSEEDNT